jgi:hypothetical protein
MILLHLKNTLKTRSDKLNTCEDRAKPGISLDTSDLGTSLTNSDCATCCGPLCMVMELILHTFFTTLNLKIKHHTGVLISGTLKLSSCERKKG